MFKIFGIFIITTCVFIFSVAYGKLTLNTFPKGFMFGIASSAYQVEGGWQENGKGESIWDRFTHDYSEKIIDGSNGDIASDSYHNIEEDVKLLKNLGVHFYYFSLSWSRILPKGFSYKINPDGIRYYNKLLDSLLANDLAPVVAMFHSDTPQAIEDMGGFSSALVVDWFENYARVVFENFGDRVKYWITFGEPSEMCQSGYGGDSAAPGYNSSGVGVYLCAHNVLKSHAKVYHLYNDNFKRHQGGRISISLDGTWFVPSKHSVANVDAAERLLAFNFGWFADPIYYAAGDYPKIMKEFIAKRSDFEGFSSSRLPDFTQTEIDYIKGTFDYFALSHYTTFTATDIEEFSSSGLSYNKDYRAEYGFDPSWPQSSLPWIKVVPWGFRDILKYIKSRYGNLEIIITGNGYPDNGEINDFNRINYHKLYLDALLNAIYVDRVNVTGYAIRSFMDGFEGKYGYTTKFGIYHVNFFDPSRTRTPKSSVDFYRKIITKGKARNGSDEQISNTYLLIFVISLSIFHMFF